MNSSSAQSLAIGGRPVVRTLGLAVLLLTTLALVAPVWAAKPSGTGSGGGGGGGGGNQGTVKVVDTETAQEAPGNDPHVCAFFLEFGGAPVGETGSWWILDWPPTGTGDEVDSGSYQIDASGTDVTDTFLLQSGHYRVEWQGVNDSSRKHKTLWVDQCADEPAVEPPAVEPPADEPADGPANGQLDEPADEPADDPVEEPADQPADAPADERADGPADEPLDEPADEPADDPVEEPADQPAAARADEPADEPADGADEPADEPANDPVDESTEGPADEPASEPVNEPADQPINPEGDQAPNLNQPIVDVLPDTAIPTPAVPAGMVALGILVLVAAQRTHREQRLDRQG